MPKFSLCLFASQQHLNIAFSIETFIVSLSFYRNLFLCVPFPVKYLLSLSFSKVLTFACGFTTLFSHFSMQFFSFSLVLSMDISTLTLPTYFYFFTVISNFPFFFTFSIKSLLSLCFKAQKGRSWGVSIYKYIHIYVFKNYLAISSCVFFVDPEPLSVVNLKSLVFVSFRGPKTRSI